MCFSWYLKAFSQKYATFSGRAHRTEFWCVTLFSFIGFISLFLVDQMFGFDYSEEGIGLFSGIFLFVNLLPNIAVFIRRLHDSGRGDWWYLFTLIPVIGLIVFILFSLARSKEDNKYGKNPHNLKI